MRIDKRRCNAAPLCVPCSRSDDDKSIARNPECQPFCSRTPISRTVFSCYVDDIVAAARQPNNETIMNSTSTYSRLARFFAITCATVNLVACMATVAPPGGLDYSRTRTSAAGHYRATIRPAHDTIIVGKIDSWTLHVEDAAGRPVDSATISVNGGMPQHRHGLPTNPKVTRAAGNGNHIVEGMKFNMGGWWVVRFRVNAAAGADSLVFNLKL